MEVRTGRFAAGFFSGEKYLKRAIDFCTRL